MMPEKCPFCGNPLSLGKLAFGYVYCRNAHVLTVAPLYELDPIVVTKAATEAATLAQAEGRLPDHARSAVARWRARAGR